MKRGLAIFINHIHLFHYKIRVGILINEFLVNYDDFSKVKVILRLINFSTPSLEAAEPVVIAAAK